MRSRLLLLLISILLIVGCYPLATGSMKWKIDWDEDLLSYKKAFLGAKPKTVKQPPNVIIIMADDLGKYEVSAYGERHMHTPNIDKLASEGVLFEKAYASAPVCGPSRAGIMTGRYQHRFGYETQDVSRYPNNIITYLGAKYLANTDDFMVMTKPRYPRNKHNAKQGVPPTEIMLSELFKKSGYKTAFMGKWHMGSSDVQVPLARGYDHSYGFLGHSTIYTPEQTTPGYATHVQDQFSARHQWKEKRTGASAIREDGIEVIEEDYLTWAIRDKGINWMKENKDDPFFLYLSFNAPHVPFQAPDDYYDKWITDAKGDTIDENHRVYYAMIDALDDAIGDVNQAVKDLGVEDNTIIWFLSDNGGASYTGATDNSILKGGKLTHFEGGISIPMMMKWPAKLQPGMVYPEMVSAMDIFTTAAAEVGMALPNDRVYDGKNLVPYLTRSTKKTPHDHLYFRADHIKAMIKGDHKFVRSTRDCWDEGYDLNSDPSEMNNIYHDDHNIFINMEEQFRSWEKELPLKPLWPRVVEKRFILEDGRTYFFPV